jgi:hypothetical protein
MIRSIIPNLSVDCVIFGFDSKDLNVLLVQRTLTKEKDHTIVFSDYTPPAIVREGEDPDDAAVRSERSDRLHDIHSSSFTRWQH